LAVRLRSFIGCWQASACLKRSPGGVPPAVEVIQGDAADLGFYAQAAEGAATVYHCMNPPYDAKVWAELVSRYMDKLINAAGRSGARLVVLDNVLTSRIARCSET
jgi:hypothetical protein